MGYIHFAFLGPESLWAAEASECAADQDAFWEYHDLLFERQTGASQVAFSKENLKGFAAEMGLDTAAFDQCMDTGKYTELVQANSTAAQSLGVRSTPSFVVNGEAIVGAQPYDAFRELIERKLQEQ